MKIQAVLRSSFDPVTVLVALSVMMAASASRAFTSGPSWPYSIPCRYKDSGNPELFVMLLGQVRTSLAQGVYDPVNDVVWPSRGVAIKSYYRDSLGVRYYAPIDKSVFPLPPSGWCSWYYYYQEVAPEEVMKNARWIAANLKDFGATLVQVDDGWQGTGHGSNGNRDWTTIDRRFSSGMDHLARDIGDLGLVPGLWLAPHGQSNPAVVRVNPDVFLMKTGDSSASDTWEGRYLVDPSTPAALQYLKDLFTTLSGWGYEYFKIDGQPIVIDEYRAKSSFMRRPGLNPDSLYRNTLSGIRLAIGPRRYLLGCWGIPLDGTGIMNGSRTGGDVVPGWDGFRVALDATMRYYYLHNITWYCDPDVMLVRLPLTLDQARAWATLEGLTGQALMASDNLTDLPVDRIDVLKRVFPAVDIRPLDLFPSHRMKRIWDLKVNQEGRAYDVVALFNFDEDRSEVLTLDWSDLGLPDTGAVHVFDFWNKEYLGAWERGMSFRVGPASCRVLALAPATGHVQLVSTSRHITQGWVDLEHLEFNAGENTYSGNSKLVAGDPYELRFAFPRGKGFRVSRASAGKLPVTVRNYETWAAVEFQSPATGDVAWEVSFEPAVQYHFPVHQPYGLSVAPAGVDGVDLTWAPDYYLTAGYQVSLNGVPAGESIDNVFALRGLDPRKDYAAEVRCMWSDGTVSTKAAGMRFTIASLLPRTVSLSGLPPVEETSGWGEVRRNRSVSGAPLSIGGTAFASGLGTHAASDIRYRLLGLFDTFHAVVGIDDGSEGDKGSAAFVVIGDGKELWRSGVMRKRDGARQVSIGIRGVQELLLRVTDGGDGIDYDHADWAEATVGRSSP